MRKVARSSKTVKKNDSKTLSFPSTLNSIEKYISRALLAYLFFVLLMLFRSWFANIAKFRIIWSIASWPVMATRHERNNYYRPKMRTRSFFLHFFLFPLLCVAVRWNCLEKKFRSLFLSYTYFQCMQTHTRTTTTKNFRYWIVVFVIVAIGKIKKMRVRMNAAWTREIRKFFGWATQVLFISPSLFLSSFHCYSTNGRE